MVLCNQDRGSDHRARILQPKISLSILSLESPLKLLCALKGREKSIGTAFILTSGENIFWVSSHLFTGRSLPPLLCTHFSLGNPSLSILPCLLLGWHSFVNQLIHSKIILSTQYVLGGGAHVSLISLELLFFFFF